MPFVTEPHVIIKRRSTEVFSLRVN